MKEKKNNNGCSFVVHTVCMIKHIVRGYLVPAHYSTSKQFFNYLWGKFTVTETRI